MGLNWPRNAALLVSVSSARVFERFPEACAGTKPVKRLCDQDLSSKVGRPLDKGYVYKLLNNRTDVGNAEHKGNIHPGEHQGVVPRGLWDRAQAPHATKTKGRASIL